MNSTRIAVLLLLAFATVGLAAPMAWADPPPWAPAHGWRAKQRYVYYPSAEVYSAPDTRMWFWLGGDGWQAGVSLPVALQGYVQVGGVEIDLDVDRPYLRNDDVVRRYGGQRHHWRQGGDDQGHAHGRDQGHPHGHHDH
jgi:hypothetical protein